MMNYIQPVADLHTHTLYSMHAYSTIGENAAAAARQGLLAIAMTDHAPAIPEPSHRWHFTHMNLLPPHIAGVRVFRGIEANVLDFDGRLDIDDGMIRNLDIVIASMHGGGIMKEGTKEEITAAWMAVANDARVDVIGHPGTPMFTFDYETVVRECARQGKIIEINENSFNAREGSLENCTRIAYYCKKYGVRVMLSSDAHFYEYVGKFDRSILMLKELAFPIDLVINANRQNLETYLKEKKLAL